MEGEEEERDLDTTFREIESLLMIVTSSVLRKVVANLQQSEPFLEAEAEAKYHPWTLVLSNSEKHIVSFALAQCLRKERDLLSAPSPTISPISNFRFWKTITVEKIIHEHVHCDRRRR